MRKKVVIAVAVLAFSVALGFWWDNGGQAWSATWTGTDNCINVPQQYVQVCKHYGFWSGFGSVMPWTLFSMSTFFAGLALLFRHTNCHEKGCWRIGKFELSGGEYKVCGKHHPGFEGKHPSLEHMWASHLHYKGKART